MIRINSNNILFQQRNFWNHIHFHPTDAIEDCWGQEILNSASSDKVAEYVRIYAMLEDIVTCDETGNLLYDFSETDVRIEYMLKCGFKLLICMNFMPVAIALDPGCISSNSRYKGKKLCSSAPKDYKLWQEVCTVYVKHLLERYGEEKVYSWYFHCWNEPNIQNFWMNNEPDLNTRTEEYLKLYDYFAAALKGVSTKIKIGGPSAAYRRADYPLYPGYEGAADLIFIHKFFHHIKSETNYATGDTGTPIDFYSIHVYGASGNFTKLDPKDSYKIGNDHIKVAKEYGYENLEIIGDEWEATTCGYLTQDECPSFAYRNSSMFSAHYFALIDYFIKHKAPYSKLMICLSGQHNLEADFNGSRTFASKNGFKLPIYNGYALAAMLGENHLECHNDSKVGVLPTMDDEGNIIIALYNYSVNRLKLNGPQHVKFEISVLEGNYKVAHYRLDDENCNSYTAWLKEGSPKNISQEQREHIKQAEKIKLWYPEEEFCGFQYTDSIVMNDDAVSIIKLTKQA